MQKGLMSVELRNQHGCAGRLQGLKPYAALHVPQISPCYHCVHIGIFWAAFPFCFSCFSQHSLLWISLKTFPFALRFRPLHHWGRTAEALGLGRSECGVLWGFFFFSPPEVTPEMLCLTEVKYK